MCKRQEAVQGTHGMVIKPVWPDIAGVLAEISWYRRLAAEPWMAAMLHAYRKTSLLFWVILPESTEKTLKTLQECILGKVVSSLLFALHSPRGSKWWDRQRNWATLLSFPRPSSYPAKLPRTDQFSLFISLSSSKCWATFLWGEASICPAVYGWACLIFWAKGY